MQCALKTDGTLKSIAHHHFKMGCCCSKKEKVDPGLDKASSPLPSHKSHSQNSAALGMPFPKRPWGAKLSQKTWVKLEELFRKMDPDGSNAVSREEAQMFFKGTFGKLSADAMFNEVDVDGSGAIDADEFIRFWVHVRKNGYKEKDILEEVEEMIDGGAWVDWKDGRDTGSNKQSFPTRPMMCRLSAPAWKKCQELFIKMDGKDGALAITKPKATKHFKGGKFGGSSVDAMFNEIDMNNHGQISAKEFMKFWVQVRSNGYKDQDILDEVENLLEGEAWVDWKDGRNTG